MKSRFLARNLIPTDEDVSGVVEAKVDLTAEIEMRVVKHRTNDVSFKRIVRSPKENMTQVFRKWTCYFFA